MQVKKYVLSMPAVANGEVLFRSGTRFTPGLAEFLKSRAVRSVRVDALDHFGRTIEVDIPVDLRKIV